MIRLKTKEEIEIMKEGGRRLQKVIKELLPIIQVGISTKEIDEAAGRLIKKYGGTASFKKVKGYHWNTCLPINEQVVHTPPSGKTIKSGDLLTLDIGMYYQGFHTDYAQTLIVGGNQDDKLTHFLEAGRRTLFAAIEEARMGRRLGLISQAIEKEIYKNGFYVLKELTGHGIGRHLHEDPYVFGYGHRPIEKTLLIKSGLTIAIEVIYSASTEKIIHEGGNDWSVVTADGSLSACFEHTVAVTENATLILT
jgi:methionyl aminopeptidase